MFELLFLQSLLLATGALGAGAQNIRSNSGRTDAIPRINAGLVVSSGRTYSPTIVQLDTDKVVLCFTDGTASMHGICHVLDASGNMIRKGNSVVVNDSPTYFPALARLGPDRALLCYRTRSNSHSGNCNVLTVEGSVLSHGGGVTVNFRPMNQPALAQLDTDKTVLCYPVVGQTPQGKCRVLLASGTTLIQGKELTIATGPMHHPTVAQLTTDIAVLCYLDKNRLQCTVLNASGTELTSGGYYAVETMSMFYITLAPFDANSVVLCYADVISCRLLHVSGMVITTGDVLTIGSGSMSHPAISRFNMHTLVLYQPDDGSTMSGKLHTLAVSGTKLQRDKSIDVTGGYAYQPAIAQLDTNRTMLCYIRNQVYCHLAATPGIF